MSPKQLRHLLTNEPGRISRAAPLARTGDGAQRHRLTGIASLLMAAHFSNIRLRSSRKSVSSVCEITGLPMCNDHEQHVRWTEYCKMMQMLEVGIPFSKARSAAGRRHQDQRHGAGDARVWQSRRTCLDQFQLPTLWSEGRP